MIRARDLTKRYGDLAVVAGVSLEVRRGEFVAVMGRSGAGKTTLLSLLGGLARPSAGEVWVDGTPLHRLGERELARWRAERVGFAFQFASLVPTLTALENVLLPAAFAPRRRGDPRRRAEELLALVGLAGLGERLPGQLSGGEQRRVALARALMNDPPLLLADEPTGDLDQETEAAVLDLLRRLQGERGLTLVVVTHSPAVAGAAERVLTMAGGRLAG